MILVKLVTWLVGCILATFAMMAGLYYLGIGFMLLPTDLKWALLILGILVALGVAFEAGERSRSR